MTLNTEQIQLIRLMYDIARKDIPHPESEQVDAFIAQVELYLISQQLKECK